MGIGPVDLWARFAWTRGTCFRCETKGVPVATVGAIEVREIPVELRACHYCVFRLEQLHWFEVGRRRLRRDQSETPLLQNRPKPSVPSLPRHLSIRRRLCVPGVALVTRRTRLPV